MTSVILGIFFIIAVSIWLIGCNSQVDDVTIRFVAVGSNGVVIYSTDGGKNWTEGTLGTQDNLFNLFGIATDGKGNWVTVGRDTLNINGITAIQLMMV